MKTSPITEYSDLTSLYQTHPPPSQMIGLEEVGQQLNPQYIYDLLTHSIISQGAFGELPQHGKRDGFPTMNIPTLEQFPPFEGNSYIIPTHKRELCKEGIM